MKDKTIKPDHKIIIDIINKGSKVLDLGCGDGELLHDLAIVKKVKTINTRGVIITEGKYAEKS